MMEPMRTGSVLICDECGLPIDPEGLVSAMRSALMLSLMQSTVRTFGDGDRRCE